MGGHFRVAVAIQAAAHELEVPVCWGGRWDSLLAIASPEDSVADDVAACRARGRRPFLDGPHFGLSRACRHDRLDQTVQGIAGGAVVCRKDGSYMLCNFSGGFPW